MSEIKKNNVPEEIMDDELDLVAGGYSAEEWAKMTVEEQRAAQMRSMMAKRNNQPCELE